MDILKFFETIGLPTAMQFHAGYLYGKFPERRPLEKHKNSQIFWSAIILLMVVVFPV